MRPESRSRHGVPESGSRGAPLAGRTDLPIGRASPRAQAQMCWCRGDHGAPQSCTLELIIPGLPLFHAPPRLCPLSTRQLRAPGLPLTPAPDPPDAEARTQPPWPFSALLPPWPGPTSPWQPPFLPSHPCPSVVNSVPREAAHAFTRRADLVSSVPKAPPHSEANLKHRGPWATHTRAWCLANTHCLPPHPPQALGLPVHLTSHRAFAPAVLPGILTLSLSCLPGPKSQISREGPTCPLTHHTPALLQFSLLCTSLLS